MKRLIIAFMLVLIFGNCKYTGQREYMGCIINYGYKWSVSYLMHPVESTVSQLPQTFTFTLTWIKHTGREYLMRLDNPGWTIWLERIKPVDFLHPKNMNTEDGRGNK